MGALVAPREGSVDRNRKSNKRGEMWITVAPREGSVDRNGSVLHGPTKDFVSLPARGAWIEILFTTPISPLI